jgi:flagellar M-ring protein FliF
MPDVLTNMLSQLRQSIAGPGRAKVIGLGLVAVALVGLMAGVIIWASQPDFAPLYSGLDDKEAARVVNSLEEQGIPFELTDGGSTIQVQRSDLYRLRIKLAAEGGPSVAMPGYELLDEQRMGMSDREMEVMHKRALEGELAKTLATLSWVETAIVHIVTPKPSLFTDEQMPTTASVTIVTDPRRPVPRTEVQSVVSLVSASVEGLHPNYVTVVDSQGNLLTEAHRDDEMLGKGNRQLELARKVDNYLSEVGQNIMNRVVGSGRSVVRVSAQLDFSYMERTSRVFDPEKSIVRSQQLKEESSTGIDTTATQEESQIVNYEVNEVLEHSRGQLGAISRMTVSLVVDGTYGDVENADGDVVPTYIPRSSEEMEKLMEIVKSSVGFSVSRGDEINAHNIAFDGSNKDDDLADIRKIELRNTAFEMLNKAIFIAGVIAFLFLLRKTMLRINLAISQTFDDKRALILASAKGETEVELEEEIPLSLEMESSQSPEQRQMMKVHKKVSEYCVEHPEDAAKLIKTWILEV